MEFSKITDLYKQNWPDFLPVHRILWNFRRKDLDEKSEIDQTEPIFERGAGMAKVGLEGWMDGRLENQRVKGSGLPRVSCFSTYLYNYGL